MEEPLRAHSSPQLGVPGVTAGASPTRTGPAGVPSRWIVGIRIDGVTMQQAVDQIARWAQEGQTRYISVATIHLTMEAHDDPAVRDIVNSSDMVIPDGMPMVWALRCLGVRGQQRVCGADLTPALCDRAETDGIAVGVYGLTQDAMAKLLEVCRRRWPRLNVAYAFSPPFHELGAIDERRIAADMANSGARLIFVGLGGPKQERWTARQVGLVPGVLLPVGAALDVLAGTKSRPPRWAQRHGLEWLHRLATEPRRLWFRYLYHNPRWLGLFVRQIWLEGRHGGTAGPQL